MKRHGSNPPAPSGPGRRVDCGLHGTAERAHRAYLSAKASHHSHHGAAEAA